MLRPRSHDAIVKLIEFEYFLGLRPSEILKNNHHLKQTKVYRICKTLELWSLPYPAQRLSIWGRPRKKRLIAWLNFWQHVQPKYYLDELQYYIPQYISAMGFRSNNFLYN